MSETRALSTGIGTSYIVRIYRRAPADDPQRRSHDAVELVGIVEEEPKKIREPHRISEELDTVDRHRLLVDIFLFVDEFSLSESDLKR